MLPVILEIITLRNIRSTARRKGAKLVHAAVDLLARSARRGDVGLMPAHSRISAAVVCDNGEREGVQHCRIRGRVSCCRHRFWWRPGHAFVEVQADVLKPRTGKQGVGESILL